MGTYVDLDGVQTWYEEHGTGDPVVLLHPGGTDARAFAPNIGALSARFRTFTPERRGHGHTPDVDGPITFEAMAEDTVRFLERVVGGPARLVGCSDGAIVALLVALRRPDLVNRLVFAAGVFHHDGWLPQVIDPANEAPDFLVASYGEVSPDGVDHYRVVADKLTQMHLVEPTLTRHDLAKVRARTLLMFGDDDEVTLEHAVALYRALPDAELTIVPGTSHGLLVEKPELCNGLIVDFLVNDPVPTLAPIRRAAGGRSSVPTFARPIPILRIFDREKAGAFYVEYLGFRVDWEHRFSAGAPLYMQVSRGGMVLHLSEHHGDGTPGSAVYVETEGVRSYHAELQGKGYRFLNPGVEVDEIGTCLTLLDPFGNILRFNERPER